jgi:hypothetical protein
VRHYEALTNDLIRVKVRLRALYRSAVIVLATSSIYEQRRPEGAPAVSNPPVACGGLVPAARRAPRASHPAVSRGLRRSTARTVFARKVGSIVLAVWRTRPGFYPAHLVTESHPAGESPDPVAERPRLRRHLGSVWRFKEPWTAKSGVEGECPRAPDIGLAVRAKVFAAALLCECGQRRRDRAVANDVGDLRFSSMGVD